MTERKRYDMDNLEKAEKIREKTGVTYDEAKRALEACNYDMLDAIVYLETLGKIRGPQQSFYTSGSFTGEYNEAAGSAEFITYQQDYEKQCKGTSMGESLDKVFSWVGKMIKKAWDIKFVVFHQEKEMIRIPLLILIILMFATVFVTAVVLVVGLFCDCKYRFEGVEDVNVNLNDLCDRAGSTAQDIKNDFKNKK